MASSPSLSTTTRLVARSLGLSPSELTSSLRPAVAADLPVIVAMRAEEFGPQVTWDDQAYLLWRYRMGRSDGGLGELWVVEHADSIFGLVGTEDMVCRIGTKQYPAERIMDLLVRPDARESGLGTWMNLATFQRAGLTIDVGANVNSLSIVKRVFRLVRPRLLYGMRVDFTRPLQRRLGNRVSAKLAAGLANVTSKGIRKAAGMVYGSHSLSMRSIDRFDLTLDDLFGRSIPPDSDSVVAERTASQLNSRLFENPRASYTVHGAYRGGNWLGYIAWRCAREANGEKWIYVIDWLADVGSREPVLSAMLRFVAEEAMRLRCGFISMFVQDPVEIDIARRHGFIQQRGPEEVVGYYTEDSALASKLANAKWCLTSLSSDQDAF